MDEKLQQQIVEAVEAVLPPFTPFVLCFDNQDVVDGEETDLYVLTPENQRDYTSVGLLHMAIDSYQRFVICTDKGEE